MLLNQLKLLHDGQIDEEWCHMIQVAVSTVAEAEHLLPYLIKR